MPLYEYECQECRKVTESIREERVKRIACPECNGEAHRRMSVSSIRIKGYCEANGYA